MATKSYLIFEVVSTSGKGSLVKLNIRKGDDVTKKEVRDQYINSIMSRNNVSSACLYKEPDGRFIFTKENPSTSGV